DSLATGVQPSKTRLLPTKQAWTSPTLDGQLYGEPLVANGRVIAATENDSVYAISAPTGDRRLLRNPAPPRPHSLEAPPPQACPRHGSAVRRYLPHRRDNRHAGR